MMKAPNLFTAACLLAFCGYASAYTLNGTVTTKDGKAIQGADVKLVKKNKATTTDEQGKFTFKEESAHLNAVRSAGSFSLSNGVLNFSQNGYSPVQVKIFDMVGNQVFAQTLQGSGSMDLNSVIESQGTYLARVKLGSAQESIRFNATGNYSGSFRQNRNALMKVDGVDKDTLSVAFEGYETVKVYLPNLDTTVAIKMNEVSTEETFKFGYALGNSPTPSKGCGTNSKLQKVKSVENGDQFEIKVGGDSRKYFITLPKNYDNKKPHKVLFALHCYGSNGEDFVHHKADYDHPTPYYGQQVLDKNGDYIFVSLDAIGGLWSKGQADHDFFAQTLTTLNENYCIDTSRVFITGFSYGAMFSYSLMQDMQTRVRAAATYAVADYNIWLPEGNNMKNLPIAWMNVHGVNDGRCDYNRAKNSALPRILKRNGKADANGDFTDASSEKPKEVSGNTGHVCYDFTTVDERFPVKWCSWPGDHQWTAHDTGNMGVGWNWESTWVPEEVHKFFEQF